MFQHSNASGIDGVGHVYTLVRPGVVNAAQLVAELEQALGLVLQGPSQQGHLVTAELSYGAGTLVQVRLRADQPALSDAQQQAAEQTILAHQAA